MVEAGKSVDGYIALGVLLLMLCVQSTAIREMREEVRKQVNRKQEIGNEYANQVALAEIPQEGI